MRDGVRNTEAARRLGVPLGTVGHPGRAQALRVSAVRLHHVSDDIRRLSTDTLDQLGVEWTHCTRDGNPYDIPVARRASVALMDAHVGPEY